DLGAPVASAIRVRLAAGAEEGRAPLEHEAPDRGAAAGAGAPLAPVDAERPGVAPGLAVRVPVVTQRRPSPIDGLAQHMPERPVEAAHLLRPDVPGRAGRLHVR